MALLSAVLGGVILTMIEGATMAFTRVAGRLNDPLEHMMQGSQGAAPTGASPLPAGLSDVSGGAGEIERGFSGGSSGSQQPTGASAGISNYV